MIVWEPTLALIALLIAGMLLTRSIFSAIAFSIFGLYSAAGLAVVVGLMSSLETRTPLLLAIAAVGLLISILYAFRVKKIAKINHWLGAGVFVALSLVSQIVSRSFGFSSVAFGDGHTIMAAGQVFQGAPGELLSGTKALKRGFGLPSLQSFGFDREYLVGFLPIFFVAALVLTVYFFWLISPTKLVFLSVTSVALAVVFSTEAIMRHLFLMNTHSTAWLFTAFFLIMVWKHLYSEINTGEVATILLAFGTIAFLRIDFILLFSPYLLVFILISTRINKLLAIGSLFAVAIPAWLWMTFAVNDFPYFGSAGPSLLAAVGVIGGTAIAFGQGNLRRPIKPLTGKLLWVIASFFSFAVLVLTNPFRSFESIFTNLFLGEGLWGFSFWMLVVVALASLLTKRIATNADFDKAAARLFAASVAVYIFTKFLDGNSLWQVGGGWSRVGFGDSFNRTLVTWLPFLFIPLVKLMAGVFPAPVKPIRSRDSRK